MLSMAEKTFLGLMIILSFTLIGVIVFPVSTYEVGLVTIPNTDEVNLPAGTPFNITCKVYGDDAEKFSSLKWLNKEEKVMLNGTLDTVLENDNSLTLTFTEPKETDSGVYKCVADYRKTTLQKSVNITFHGEKFAMVGLKPGTTDKYSDGALASAKPLFEEDYENITALEKTTVHIFCAAEGENPIQYEWYTETDEKIEENSHLPIYVMNELNVSVLIITNVALSNEGMYICFARNKHGLSSKIFDLTVLSEGGEITNETITSLHARVKNITSTSVTFDLKVPGPVTKIQVKYVEASDKAYKFKEFTYGDVYKITDLIPSGLYSFQFKKFPSTEVEWSSSYRVVLLPSKPEVIFQSIDSGTVKLHLRLNNRMRKTIDKHEISYFTVQPNGEINWKPSTCAIKIQIPVCAEDAYTLSGLSVNDYYEIQVRAHTESGYGEPYKQKIFMKK